MKAKISTLKNNKNLKAKQHFDKCGENIKLRETTTMLHSETNFVKLLQLNRIEYHKYMRTSMSHGYYKVGPPFNFEIRFEACEGMPDYARFQVQKAPIRSFLNISIPYLDNQQFIATLIKMGVLKANKIKVKDCPLQTIIPHQTYKLKLKNGVHSVKIPAIVSPKVPGKQAARERPVPCYS